jgi:hypothetical protein
MVRAVRCAELAIAIRSAGVLAAKLAIDHSDAKPCQKGILRKFDYWIVQAARDARHFFSDGFFSGYIARSARHFLTSSGLFVAVHSSISRSRASLWQQREEAQAPDLTASDRALSLSEMPGKK